MIYFITDGDDEAPNKLVVATCTLGMMRVEPMVYLSRCGTPLGQKRMQMWVIGHTTQDARNIAVTYALGKGYEYLMFWDDDVVPLPSDVMPKGFGAAEVLLSTMDQNPEIDILGGVYPARQVVPAPIVTMKPLGDPWWGWEDGGIHKVWMTGTGFTIYRLSSLIKLQAEPVDVIVPETGGTSKVLEYFVLDPMGPTDDYHLAKRAEAAGLTWYVHGGVTALQINPDGQVFHFDKARQKKSPLEVANGKGKDTDVAEHAHRATGDKRAVRGGGGRRNRSVPTNGANPGGERPRRARQGAAL